MLIKLSSDLLLIYLHLSPRKSIYLLPVKLGLTQEPQFPQIKIINKYFREVYQD